MWLIFCFALFIYLFIYLFFYLFIYFNSEPSLAERKALATAVGKQEAAQRLLGQCYCTLVLGLGLEDKHHMGCGR